MLLMSVCHSRATLSDKEGTKPWQKSWWQVIAQYCFVACNTGLNQILESLMFPSKVEPPSNNIQILFAPSHAVNPTSSSAITKAATTTIVTTTPTLAKLIPVLGTRGRGQLPNVLRKFLGAGPVQQPVTLNEATLEVWQRSPHSATYPAALYVASGPGAACGALHERDRTLCWTRIAHSAMVVTLLVTATRIFEYCSYQLASGGKARSGNQSTILCDPSFPIR